MAESFTFQSQKEILVISIHNIFYAAIVLAFIGLISAFLLKEISLDKDEEVVKEIIPLEAGKAK